MSNIIKGLLISIGLTLLLVLAGWFGFHKPGMALVPFNRVQVDFKDFQAQKFTDGTYDPWGSEYKRVSVSTGEFGDTVFASLGPNMIFDNLQKDDISPGTHEYAWLESAYGSHFIWWQWSFFFCSGLLAAGFVAVGWMILIGSKKGVRRGSVL